MQSTSLAGRTILVVEDELLIALHIVSGLQKAGAKDTPNNSCYEVPGRLGLIV